MSEEHEVKLLSLVDVLEPLSEEELEEVSTRCPSFSLEAGQEIYGSREHDGGLFLLEEGHVFIYKMTSSGKQITFTVHSAGTVFPALRLQGLIARAIESSVLAFMSREDLQYFLRRKPQMGLRLMDLLAENLRLMDVRISEVIHKRVSARLASLIAWLVNEEDRSWKWRSSRTLPLHPRAAGNHHRSQTGGYNPCFRRSPGRGSCGTEATADPR